MVSNTRPDLAAQVASGQQRIGQKTTVGDLKFVNQLPRRSRQLSDTKLIFHSIPVSEWLVTMHADASLANCEDKKTQGGDVVGLSEKKLLQGKPARRSLLGWKSLKLAMASASTLWAEAQA